MRFFLNLLQIEIGEWKKAKPEIAFILGELSEIENIINALIVQSREGERKRTENGGDFIFNSALLLHSALLRRKLREHIKNNNKNFMAMESRSARLMLMNIGGGDDRNHIGKSLELHPLSHALTFEAANLILIKYKWLYKFAIRRNFFGLNGSLYCSNVLMNMLAIFMNFGFN